MVPGERAVAELVRAAPGRVRRVLIEKGRLGSEVAELARAAGLIVEIVPRAELEQATGGAPPRGVVALADPPPLHDEQDLARRAMAASGRGLLVALDGVVDPQNVGAVIRSAEFFGACGMFWARDRAPGLSAAAVRASAGASERLALGVVTNLARALATCKDEGLWVVGTVASGGDPLAELAQGDRLARGLVLVFGGEEHGLRRITRDTCDVLVTIEGQGELASLNVSAAAAVVLAALA